jgi:hypothetical protein
MSTVLRTSSSPSDPVYRRVAPPKVALNVHRPLRA